MKARTVLVLMLVISSTLGTTIYACSDAQEPATSDESAGDFSATSVAPTGEAASNYVTVDVNTAYEQLSIMNNETQIVDVREPDEWAATGVPVGAVLIPLGELAERAPTELASSVPVYVICNSGNRSRAGSQVLLDLGYEEVYNVDGGIQAWLAAGLPVEYRR